MRGLDYYTRTVFEFDCDALGAQSGIGGGGRYDGLIEQLGGPPTPGVGWAAGSSGSLLALERGGADGRRRATSSSSPRPTSRDAARSRWSTELRRAGLAAELDLAGRGLKGQMKQADRVGARYVVILDEDGDGDRCATWTPASRSGRSTRATLVDEHVCETRMSDEFPALRANAYRDTWCGQVLPDRRRLRGAGRRLGAPPPRPRRAVFIDLRDRTGLVQLVFNPDEAGDAFELGHELRAEDVITVARRRSCGAREETVNPELPTGEVEVRVDRGRAARRRRDAAVPDRGGPGEVSEETRLRYRYLDLRREPDAARRSSSATEVVAAMREFLDGEGFLEIETPILTRSTPEGARDFLVPSRLQPGSFYALPQSPQLFKQLLMIGRLRALLPDRALLPRRGPARRPPARVHPARPRDVVRRRRRRDRR